MPRRTSHVGLALVLLLLVGAAFAAGPPPEILAAAVDGLPALLEAIPAGAVASFGFDDDAQTARCDLGTFLPLRLIDPEAVTAVATGAVPVFTDPEAWIVVVRADARARALLTVAWHRDAWRAVDLGAAATARSLQDALDSHPSADPALVRVLQAGAVFLQPERGVPARLVPLAGTGKLIGRPDGVATTDVGDIMRRLQPLVAANLESFPTTDGPDGR